MSYLIESGTEEKTELPVRFKRIYARARRQFEMGLWGQNSDCIKCVTLTTWSGSEISQRVNKGDSRNTWKQIVSDNRELRRVMKKDGMPYEDSFCAEISPKSGLVHLHGFMRFEDEYSYEDVHERLSFHWGKIHQSPVVWVKDMWDWKGAIAYDVKHSLKNYVGERFLFNGSPPRILRSKRWLPKGWRDAQREIARWASEKVDFLPNEKEIVSDDYYKHEYVWHKWDVANDMLKRWCEGEDIYLDREACWVLLSGDQITIVEFEEIGEVVGKEQDEMEQDEKLEEEMEEWEYSDKEFYNDDSDELESDSSLALKCRVFSEL